MYRMLLINPGSTSTKIAVFEDENNVYEKTLRHTAEELAPFPTVASQKDLLFRSQAPRQCDGASSHKHCFRLRKRQSWSMSNQD